MRAVVLLVVALGAAASCRPAEEGVVRPEPQKLDQLPAGAQALVRLQYNDTNDVYRAFIGSATVPLRLQGVRLALLSDADIAAGAKPHILDDGKGPIARVGPRFKIGVIHGVVEQRTVPETGVRQNVVVRTELRMWTPFLAPKIVDGKNIWAVPAFHYPPPWSDGPLVGSGAHGRTREAAFDAYRRTHGTLPQAVALELEGYTTSADLPPPTAAPSDAPKDAAKEAKAPADVKPHRIVGAIPGTKGSDLLQKQKQRAAELAKQKPQTKQRKTP